MSQTKRENTPKIFIGLCEIAGYNHSLKRGFDELGIESVFIELSDHAFNYSADKKDDNILHGITGLNKKILKIKLGFLTRILHLASQIVTRLIVFIVAVIKYNTFIFVYGGSFFKLYDLPVLKLMKKKVIFVFLGSDSRPPYLNGKFADFPVEQCIQLTKKVKNNVKRIERYADISIDHHMSAHFHEKKFIAGMRIGIPLHSLSFSVPPFVPSDKVRILHAPSDPTSKGTETIRLAIDNLCKNGHPIEYIEIVNQPNREVLKNLSQCDFVVDELYSDALMARFAAEAAFFGKPAVVSGYASNTDWHHIPEEDLPPVHHCHPDAVQACIEMLIIDKDYRNKLGMRAHDFVIRQWSEIMVAKRYLMLINGDYPADWLYDPQNVSYLHGTGFSERKAQTLVKRIIDKAGIVSLMLTDKPALEKRFNSFANTLEND